MSIKFMINNHKVAIYQIKGAIWTLIDGEIDYNPNLELIDTDGIVIKKQLAISDQLLNVINYLK